MGLCREESRNYAAGSGGSARSDLPRPHRLSRGEVTFRTDQASWDLRKLSCDQHQAHLPSHADVVRQPGIARIHPPDRHQHQQRPQEIHSPVGVLHQLGDLRDHEDEARSKKSSIEETAADFSCMGAVMVAEDSSACVSPARRAGEV